MKKILLIGGSFLMPVSIILILFRITKEPATKKNGFQRNIKLSFLKSVNGIDIGSTTHYIAGATDNFVFLGNYGKSGELLQINQSLSDRKKLYFIPGERIAWAATKLYVNYPSLFLIEGITSTVVNYPSFSNGYTLYTSDSLKFDSPIPVSDSVFFFRTNDHSIGKAVLGRDKKFSAEKISAIFSGLLGGNFSTDGILRFDETIKRLVYVFYYKNKFICLDSTLNVIDSFKTIDTTNYAKIKIDSLVESNELKLIRPAMIINRHAVVSNGLVYIHSLLRADNQPAEQFKKSSTVDVYSLSNRKYIFSFCIPDNKGNKISDMKVINDKLVVIQGSYLSLYVVNIDLFNKQPG